MNARNFLYINKYNSASAKRTADDKLATKKILIENNISTPSLIAPFYNRETLSSFDWDILPKEGFVIKPARGYAGAGILPIRKWEDGIGISVSGDEFDTRLLVAHVLDILEGAYSFKFLPDVAFIEEKVVVHPFFKKFSSVGVPDIRVIVFNNIPVMAMLRLATQNSQGKANLHQGAIGFGIDIRTGITTHAILFDQPIRHLPGSKIKTRGIKIPEWDKLMLLSSQTLEISKLGFAGVDIVFDKYKGSQVLEINSRPGLSIQNANRSSLRSRLERVENIVTPTPERGIEIAKNLFAEEFSEKVSIQPKILTLGQNVTVLHKDRSITIKAKLDTGAKRSSIDKKIADLLEIPYNDEKILIKSASGTGYRDTVNLTFELAGKKISTIATVADRSNLTFPILIGHKDLEHFLLKPIYDDSLGFDDDPTE